MPSHDGNWIVPPAPLARVLVRCPGPASASAWTVSPRLAPPPLRMLRPQEYGPSSRAPGDPPGIAGVWAGGTPGLPGSPVAAGGRASRAATRVRRESRSQWCECRGPWAQRTRHRRRYRSFAWTRRRALAAGSWPSRSDSPMGAPPGSSADGGHVRWAQSSCSLPWRRRARAVLSLRFASDYAGGGGNTTFRTQSACSGVSGGSIRSLA
jgi:hypothetical protein